MKRFILKCFCFLVLLLTALFSQKVLDRYTPWYWGYDDLYVKMEHLRNTDSRHDVLFFGSSHSFRNINPAVFDSLTGLRSFNLSLPGTQPPELYMIVEDLIAQKNDNEPQTFIIELIDLHQAIVKKDLSVRRNYWMTADNYYFGLRNSAEKGAIRTMLRYTEGFIQAQTKFGLGKQQYESMKKERDPRFALGSELNGHLSFPEQLKAGIKTRSIIERRKRFLEDDSQLHKRKERVIWEMRHPPHSRHQTHLEKINGLIKDAALKNINLVFMRGPIQEHVWGLLNAIPEGHKVDLGNPLTHPELYKSEYHFDHGHLSAEGAKLYTRLLVSAFQNGFQTP